MGSKSSDTSDSSKFEIIDHEEVALSVEKLAKLEQWLQPTDYMAESSEFKRHLASQAPHTGLWICDTPQYQQWHQSNEYGGLWIKGVPGAGKSVVSASMVQHLRSTEDIPVLFFFFRYIIVANRHPRSLVRDWLAQLLPHSIRLQATLQNVIHLNLDDFPDAQLWEFLLLGLTSIEKAYCVVDALDEMEMLGKDEFLHRLNELSTYRPKHIKLLMTSRPTQYLQYALKDASIVHISLEDELVSKDIVSFIGHRLNDVFDGSKESQAKRMSLQSIISKRSAGHFLYARLLLDQLIPALQADPSLDVEAIASTLPNGIQEMYSNMLAQQSQRLRIPTEIQVFILKAVVFSSRLLRLNELANLLNFAFPFSDLPGGAKVVAKLACAPLLEILEDETIQVIHHSFTEFLLDTQRTQGSDLSSLKFSRLDPKESHRLLATRCLQYLTSGVLGPNATDAADSNTTGEAFNYRAAKLDYPFLDYAVMNWTYHATNYDVEDEAFFTTVTRFLDQENSYFRNWAALVWNDSSFDRGPAQKDTQLLISAFHIAAFAGMTKYALSLLHENQDLDVRDNLERTPLHCACRRGHLEMVQLLLKHGASPDLDDFSGIKPLHEATRRNFTFIVQALLDCGVSPVTPKTKQNAMNPVFFFTKKNSIGETPLQYACKNGHVDTIAAMMPFLEPKHVESALWRCCMHGNADAVRATALYQATLALNQSCVEQLLIKGANANAYSKPVGSFGTARYNCTPLHALVGKWEDEGPNMPRGQSLACFEILKLLLKYGADLEAKTGRGQTALTLCFTQRRAKTAMTALLESGAKVTTKKGLPLIHQFLEHVRNLELLDLLLRHGADINAQSDDGDTCLHAIFRGAVMNPAASIDDTIEFLLEKGAQLDVENKSGRTAIQRVANTQTCGIDTFKKMLRHCANMEHKRRCLFVLNKKTKAECILFIKELVAAGLSLDSRDNLGRTALIANVRCNCTFDALLDCGAQLDAKDNRGRGVWHHLAESCGYDKDDLEKLRQFAKDGMDPFAVSNSGDSILHEAVATYNQSPEEAKAIRQFIDFGISINSKNNFGQTPLHVHIEGREGRYRTSSQWNKKNPEHLPLLQLLLESPEKLDINTKDHEGLTALHSAAMHSEIHVRRLLRAGADPKILTNNGRSILHLACRARRSDIVHFLVQKTDSAMVNLADSLGRTPLHDACTSGRPESVYCLLNAGADITVQDSKGRTPLHACAEFAVEQSLWYILERPSEASGQALKDGYRPCGNRKDGEQYRYRSWYNYNYSCAVSVPNSADTDTARIRGIVQALLDAGANPMVEDSGRKMPLDLAIVNRCDDMVQALQYTIPETLKLYELASDDPKMHTEIELKKRTSVLSTGISKIAYKNLLRDFTHYFHLLSIDDVEKLFDLCEAGELTGENMAFSELPLLHHVAAAGFAEIFNLPIPLRLAKYYDDQNNILSLLKQKKVSVKDIGSGETTRNFSPLIHTTCKRSLPNMQLLAVLVERCEVDVNCRSLQVIHQGRVQDCVEDKSALHILAEANFSWQLEALQYLIERGANIDSRDRNGCTPLHIACTAAPGCDDGFWKLEFARILLDLGASPNVVDNKGLTPLHKASTSPEILRLLLDRGANTMLGKLSPFFTAIEEQQPQTLEILLEHGADANSIDASELFPLHYRLKDWNILFERTALFCASFLYEINIDVKKSTPAVKCLLHRGADPYAILNDQETLMHFVFEQGEYETICAYLDYAESHTFSFESRDQRGRTVLLAAGDWRLVAPGYREKKRVPKESSIISRLLHLGADPLAVDHERRSVLHHLLANTNIEPDDICDLINHPTAKPLLNQKDAKGYTPLQYALRLLRPSICEMLIHLGADLLEAAPMPDGKTALHWIAEQILQVQEPAGIEVLDRDYPKEHHPKCMELFKKYLLLGGDINVRDGGGNPPLFSFLGSEWRRPSFTHVDVISSLFVEDLDVDFKAVNNEGETALHIIAKTADRGDERDVKIWQFMVENGCDPWKEDEKGRSALDVVAACGGEVLLGLYNVKERKEKEEKDLLKWGLGSEA